MQSPEGAKESIGPRIVSVAPLGLWTGAIDSGPLRARLNPGRPFGPKQRNIRLLRAVVVVACPLLRTGDYSALFLGRNNSLPGVRWVPTRLSAGLLCGGASS